MRAQERPTKIGRFLIQETLGFGAMGAVYKGYDPVLHRQVAVKTLRVDLLQDDPWAQTFIDRFYREADLVGTLSHPNIVALFDAGETDDQTPFLAMEYADGETVAERLTRVGPFSPSEALPLLTQVASALDYAHGKGVLHRDVKPSNLILHEDKKVKVTDFGIAKLVSFEGESGTLPPGRKPGRLTREGALVGSPSYMSPEQAQGQPIDRRTDVFSLAVVAFEMLTGKLPFEGSNITATLYNLLHRDPTRPPLVQQRGLDAELWDEIFGKALAKDPEARFGTAKELVDALAPLLDPGLSSTARHMQATPTMIAAPGETGTIPFDRARSRRLPAPVRRKRGRSYVPLIAVGFGLAVFFGLATVTHLIRRDETPSIPSVRSPLPATAPTTSDVAQPATPLESPPPVAVPPKVRKTAGAITETKPRLTHWVKVRAPQGLRGQGTSGHVVVTFLVTRSGTVDDIVINVSTGSELDQAVVDAVRQWRYVPARRNGEIVAVRQTYTYPPGT